MARSEENCYGSIDVRLITAEEVATKVSINVSMMPSLETTIRES